MHTIKSISFLVTLLFSINVYSNSLSSFYSHSNSLGNTSGIHLSSGNNNFSNIKSKSALKLFNKYYPVVSAHYNFDYYFSFELGLYVGGFIGPDDINRVPGALGFGSEYSIEVYSDFNDRVVAGPKYTFFFLFLLVEFGVSAAVYTDFTDHANLSLRPYAGLSILGVLSLNYGYNYALTQHSFKEINSHGLQLKYRF